jgi:hypothetical protein
MDLLIEKPQLRYEMEQDFQKMSDSEFLSHVTKYSRLFISL